MMLLIASVLLALVATWWVAQPILERRAARLADAVSGEVQDAEARRRVALASLRELEYEYLAGKLDEEDHRRLRRRLSREAVEALDRADGVEREATAHACGHPNHPGAKFCGGCGSPLS